MYLGWVREQAPVLRPWASPSLAAESRQAASSLRRGLASIPVRLLSWLGSGCKALGVELSLPPRVEKSREAAAAIATAEVDEPELRCSC